MALFSCNLSLIQTPFQLNTEFVSDSLLIHTTMDSLSKRWVETVKSPHIYTVQKKKNLNSNWQSLTCTEKPLVLQFSLKLNPKKRRSRLSTHPIYWRTQIRGERSKRTGFKNRIRQKRSGEGWKIVKKKRNSSFWGMRIIWYSTLLLQSVVGCDGTAQCVLVTCGHTMWHFWQTPLTRCSIKTQWSLTWSIT